MGTVVGAIASGRVPVGNAAGDAVTSWLNPLSLLIGALFVTTGAYLSAVFLISEARGVGAGDLERYFRIRALGAALVAGVIAAAGIFALHDDARYLYDRLTDQAIPLVIGSAVCGLVVLALLVRGAYRGIRPLAVGAVVAVIWGWGVAQFPYLLPESLTIADGAAPSDTLTTVLIVFGVAVILVIPALGLLYMLSQRSMLEGEFERPRSAAGN
jgi:cytochrome d ubiquinol oxidase subunit II